jgi:hypothetical protein
MKSERARAKTLVLKWFDQGRPNAVLRRRFSSDVDRFLDEILKREDWAECLTTLLDDARALPISARGNGWQSQPTKSGSAVSSIVPGWGFGWRRVLKDEISDHYLSWFGHYARQYIHRSNIAKVLMIAWESSATILHPFGSGLHMSRYGPSIPRPTDREALLVAEKQALEAWGSIEGVEKASRSKWTSRNTLDPAIHQAIFHFLRGQSLARADFELEAVAAFDCVLQSVQALDWSWAQGDPHRSRKDLCLALGFGRKTAQLAEHMYFLRNQFAAHAGGWRWWDYVEYFEEDLLESASRLASRVLRKSADLEQLHRRVDPNPADWGNWLILNFPLVWEAVWFRDPPES